MITTQSQDPAFQALLNSALMRFSKRAESAELDDLVATFVDTGALTNLLQSRDHQVIYGRRGTGKTHALRYLGDLVSKSGDIAIYIDLRNVGSNGSLYGDTDTPFAERATRLLIDVLIASHDMIFSIAVGDPERFALLETGLDALSAAVTQVRVVEGGEGNARHRVHFGEVSSALTRLKAGIGKHRLWLLIDEWSTIPLDLQPYLADLLRRAIFPVQGVTVKIAAIEHRSVFQLPILNGDYIGIELGADASADLHLDDFMVFDLNRERAMSFFRDLLFRHFVAVTGDLEIGGAPANSEDFVRLLFTQRTPFEDLVNAAEGVPRDAMSIAALSAQKAAAERISTVNVRAAAASWYQRDKQSAVNSNKSAADLLYWIIDEVIAHRKARAFLLQAGSRHPLIDALFDARVLHIAKRGISSNDAPGARYDVYKIDYGAYVDLLATQRAPQGLLALDTPGGGQSHIEVPPDDYRAIRRAVLDLDRFEASRG